MLLDPKGPIFQGLQPYRWRPDAVIPPCLNALEEAEYTAAQVSLIILKDLGKQTDFSQEQFNPNLPEGTSVHFGFIARSQSRTQPMEQGSYEHRRRVLKRKEKIYMDLLSTKKSHPSNLSPRRSNDDDDHDHKENIQAWWKPRRIKDLTSCISSYYLGSWTPAHRTAQHLGKKSCAYISQNIYHSSNTQLFPNVLFSQTLQPPLA